MLHSKITTLSAMVIATAFSAVIAQDRFRLHKVAEVGIPGSVSSGGRFLSHVDTVDGDDHVFVRDLKTGENRCLTEGPGEAGWSVSSAISPNGKDVHPDGRRIAFTAGTPVRSEVWVMEHFVPARKGGN